MSGGFTEFVTSLLKSSLARTTGAAILATGSYIMYKDYRRYPRMMTTFARGNLLAPLSENQHEVCYFARPGLEAKIERILQPTFTNDYHLVKGEVGTGKTRLIVELTRQMMVSSGEKELGAPVYVLASQGKSFSDSLASAVNFLFDEHINFKFFLDFVLQIHSMPAKDTDHKLSRVLDAIEEAGYRYVQKHGRPVVLIIDGLHTVAAHMPGAVEKLQEKAKLWADANIVKLILVTNDERTELLLQKSYSNWSRAESPLLVGDLSKEEAMSFLEGHNFRNNSDDSPCNYRMPVEVAEQVYDLVGGRIQYLMLCKQDWHKGLPTGEILCKMREKEREKFLILAKVPQTMKALAELGKTKDKSMPLVRFLALTSQEDVGQLAAKNIIKLERHAGGMLVKYESRLTENIVEEYLKNN